MSTAALSAASMEDLLDKAREVHSRTEKDLHELKAKYQKLENEKKEIQRQCVMYSEMMNAFNVDKFMQMEISNRIDRIARGLVSSLPQEVQQGYLEALATARLVQPHEVLPQVQTQQQTQGGAQPVPVHNGMVYMTNHGPMMAAPVEYGDAAAAVPANASSVRSARNNTENSNSENRKRKRSKSESKQSEEDVDIGGPATSAKHNNSSNSVHNNHSSSNHHDSGNNGRLSGTPSESKRTSRRTGRGSCTPPVASSSDTSKVVAPVPLHAAGMPEGMILVNGNQVMQVAAPPGMRTQFIPPGIPMMPPHFAGPTAVPGHSEVPRGYAPGSYIPMQNVPHPQQITGYDMSGAPRPVTIPAPPAAAAVASGEKQPITYQYLDKQVPAAINLPPDFYNQPGMPRTANSTSVLHHNDVVCAVSIDSSNNRAYTAGRGTVKVWDIKEANPDRPLSTIEVLDKQYIRSCCILPGGRTMIVGGEMDKLALYDLEAQRSIGELAADAPACYALATWDNGNILYSCCSNGDIVKWDMRTHSVIKRINGHNDGASCLALSKDGNKLVTGGLDCKVRLWDARQHVEIKSYSYESQVFSIGYSMIDGMSDYIGVGLENSTIELLNVDHAEKYVAHFHDEAVLSLKFASSGKWFVSTSKDTKLGAWGMPYAANLFHTRDTKSLLCVDISSDDKYIITGSFEDRARIYEVL